MVPPPTNLLEIDDAVFSQSLKISGKIVEFREGTVGISANGPRVFLPKNDLVLMVTLQLVHD